MCWILNSGRNDFKAVCSSPIEHNVRWSEWPTLPDYSICCFLSCCCAMCRLLLNQLISMALRILSTLQWRHTFDCSCRLVAHFTAPRCPRYFRLKCLLPFAFPCVKVKKNVDISCTSTTTGRGGWYPYFSHMANPWPVIFLFKHMTVSVSIRPVTKSTQLGISVRSACLFTDSMRDYL